MFRKENGLDVSNKEFNDVITPFMNLCDNLLENKIIPEYVSFYIANGYKLNALWESSYDTHINSGLDVFEFDISDYSKLKENITVLLRENYKLIVTNEKPLSLEEL